jgi:hypothetical protein
MARRTAYKTLLLVGEGATEVAFRHYNLEAILAVDY